MSAAAAKSDFLYLLKEAYILTSTYVTHGKISATDLYE